MSFVYSDPLFAISPAFPATSAAPSFAIEAAFSLFSPVFA
jgi:hypothetical protein